MHFVLGGVTLFGIYRRVHREGGPIVVSSEQRQRLRADFMRRTGGAPTSAEAEALLARHVEDELLLREAARLHLHEGDVIIRRRLLQKMQLLLEAQQPAPTAAELLAHFAAHRDRFAGEARVDLIVGTPGSPIGGEQRGRSRAELARQFGGAFADRVFLLAPGERTTVASTAGPQAIELVRRYTADVTLAERRVEVEADWLRARGRVRLETELAALRRRYPVEVGQ